MSFFGKEFVLVSQENFDGFLNSLGSNLPEEVKKAIIAHKSTVKLEKNGDQFMLTTGQPNGPKKVTFSSGVEVEEEVFGKTAKVTNTLDGNVLTSVQKFDNGAITFKREFSDNQLVTTITSTIWDGVAKRVYKA